VQREDEKLISQSSFHLKGTGWYVTDYASKKGTDGKKPKKTESKVPEDTVKRTPLQAPPSQRTEQSFTLNNGV